MQRPPCQNGNAEGVVRGKLRRAEDGRERCTAAAQQRVRRDAARKHDAAAGILQQRVLRRADAGTDEAAQRIARRLLRGISGRVILFDLVLHAGKGECGLLHLDAEDLPVLRGPAQGVDVLAGRKRQAEQLAGFTLN